MTPSSKPPCRCFKCVGTIRDLTESLDYEDGDVFGQIREYERTLDRIRELSYDLLTGRSR